MADHQPPRVAAGSRAAKMLLYGKKKSNKRNRRKDLR